MMKDLSLRALMALAAVLLPPQGLAQASGQSYPTKPIRLVLGYPPGGGTDATARVVGRKLSDDFSQSVVVDNRPGATGIIANSLVAKSPADGYTLLMLTANDTALPALHAKLPFDLVRDFAPVSLVTIGPMVLVLSASSPAHNVKDLIGLAQAGKLSFGSSGVGGVPHLAGELFSTMAKVKLLHVPYKGGGELVVAVSSGQIDMCFTSITSALALAQAGKLKPLAVSSARRVSALPNVPTLDESGVAGYDYSSWYGIAAPAGVPKNIIAQLNAQIANVVSRPEIKEAFNKQGFEPQTTTPEQFASLIERDISQNTKLAKLAGIKPQ